MNKKLISCILSVTLTIGVSIGLMGCNDTNQPEGTSNNSTDGNASNKISEEKAKDIMIKKVPNGKITSFSYDNDDKIPKYEATIMKDNMEYDVDVNAQTGEILSFEEEKINDSTVDTTSNKAKNLIGEDKAKSIMLEKVPNGTFTKFELESDDGTEKYEAELTKDNKEYNISVNATTGDIISFGHESLNN